MLLLSLLYVQAVWGLFHGVEEPVDRVVNGLNQRSYILKFNNNAPTMGTNKEKVVAWLQYSIPEIEAEHVQHAYHIGSGKDFRGCALWANTSVLSQLLAHEQIEYVQEDSVVRTTGPFTDRPDWGQIRSAEKGPLDLQTNPADLYKIGYPGGGNATDDWDWTDDVYIHWNLINKGDGAFIWIVDTGILFNHQELQRSADDKTSRVTRWQDYVVPTTNASDCNGHGTHCAGSAGGWSRGIATGAEFGSVRVLNCQGSGTSANVIAGFQYTANNKVDGKHNILSASLGGGFSQASNDAIRAVANDGVIPVVAAGNNNANACSYSPASAPEAVTVGATNALDARASFSNWGSCVNVWAPGQNIHSGYFTTPTTYSTLSGTSMATPLVAGSIALYATTVPWDSKAPLDQRQVKVEIERTATRGQITGFPANDTASPNLLINANWSGE